MKTLPLIFAAVTVILPYIFQKTGLSDKYAFKMKMLCAFMYLLTGVISAVSLYSVTAYSLAVLLALSLGIFGDFFLEYNGKKFFPIGAVLFALGHIVYSVTFLFIGEYKSSSYIAAVVGITLILTAIILLFAKIKLELKGKKKMILIYAPVLVFAFASAVLSGWSAIKVGNLSFGLCLVCAGTLFLASDIMIGVGKGGIKRPEFLHHAVSYTYFAAQALFALSIYFQ